MVISATSTPGNSTLILSASLFIGACEWYKLGLSLLKHLPSQEVPIMRKRLRKSYWRTVKLSLLASLFLTLGRYTHVHLEYQKMAEDEYDTFKDLVYYLCTNHRPAVPSAIGNTNDKRTIRPDKQENC